MAKTLLDIKNDTIALINNKTASGNLIALTDPNQIDYLARVPSLANAAQKEIAATAKKIIANYRFSQYPVLNGLSNPITMFDVIEHTNNDITYTVSGATAYYFEVDNQADVYIEESINGVFVPLPVPIHISVTAKPTGFQSYTGYINPFNSANVIQIRFSGNYEYRARYIALFTQRFATLTDIPPYTRYNTYTMPTDYFQLVPDGVVFKGNQTDGYPYVKTADYFWQGFNQICINYYNKGEYTIYYYRYPTTINDSTLDTYTFEIDNEAVELIPYYCAGYLLMDEKPNIAAMLLNLYEAKLKMLNNAYIYGDSDVINTTGW